MRRILDAINVFRGRLAAGMAVCALLASCTNEEQEAGESREEPAAPVVRAAPVRTDTIEETVTQIGTLQASERVTIRPEISAPLRDIHFADGELVHDGQLLISLDDDVLRQQLRARRASLEAAKATLTNARLTAARQEELLEAGATAEENFDAAMGDLERARADRERILREIDLLQERLQNTKIYAPFTGRISTSLVDAGEFVTAGEALADLLRTDLLEMEFNLPEEYVGRVHVGQLVAVSVTPFPDVTWPGRVSYVAPFVRDNTRTFGVEAEVRNTTGTLKPGQFGRGELRLDTLENRLLIPSEALVSTRTGYIVFVLKDGKARRQKVELGHRKPGFVEITEGLSAGQRIAQTGTMQLRDGQAVRLASETSGPSKQPENPQQPSKKTHEPMTAQNWRGAGEPKGTADASGNGEG